VNKTQTSTTPPRLVLTAPTPGDKRGTSRYTSRVGAKGTTKETTTPPTQDSVVVDIEGNTALMHAALHCRARFMMLLETTSKPPPLGRNFILDQPIW